MNDTYHPLVVRFASARAMFLPELTDTEVDQMQDIAVANPDITELELNRKLVKEFGLEDRNKARERSEQDIDEMVVDFKAVIEKWGMLKMVDPLVVAGSVIHHLNGLSAVLGCYVEDLFAEQKNSQEKPALFSTEEC